MSKEIVLRVRAPNGLQRLTINTSSTLGDLKGHIEKLTGIPQRDQVIIVDDQRNQPLGLLPTTKLFTVPSLEDGTQLWVKSAGGNYQSVEIRNPELEAAQKKLEAQSQAYANIKAPSKPNEKSSTAAPSDTAMQEEKKTSDPKPTNPPPKSSDSGKPGDKNIKHESFEHYLHEMVAKTKLTPENISYKMKKTCPYHPPYPKSMCNKCMPQAANIKRQTWRHVDYAEFMNTREVSNFVSHWMQQGCAIQRGGLLYGYYAEDPNYEGGVRAIIEAIYEPPQQGEVSSFEFKADADESLVDRIAEALSLERIGWIFTTIDSNSVLTSYETRMAAKLQEQHVVIHPCGYRVTKFITVVMRHSKDEVVPDVYMVSDQCQALERDEIFTEPETRKELLVREPVETHDILPTVIVEGKPTKKIEPEFFIVNVAHGRPKTSQFSIMKHADFPVENRSTPQKPIDIKNYLKKFGNEKSYMKYSDFHLLVYLAKLLDVETVLTICEAIRNEQEVPSGIEMLLEALN